MNSTVKIALLIFISLVVNREVKGQAVFDTLNLREFEIIAIKDTYQNTYKKTTIDTLVKKDFEHFDLGQLLSAFSPVFIKSYGKGSISTASFRGTAASHTQVLWNDFAINSPMLGQVDFSYVPESFFDEVGLLYGGGSLFKTSGALGGAVLLENNDSQSAKPLMHLSQTVASFGTFNSSAAVNINYKKVTSQTRLMLQTSENDFPYYNNGVLPAQWMTQQNASYLNTGFLQQLSWQLNGWQRLSFMSWNQWNNRNIPPIMTNVYKGGNPEEYQNTFFSRNVLGWLYHRNKTRVEVKSAFFYESQHYYLKTTTSDDSANIVTLIDSKNRTSGFFTKAKWTQELKKGWKIAGGVNMDFNRVISNSYDDIKTRLAFSPYVSFKKIFRNRLTVDALMRLNITDNITLPLMPLVGINYKLLEDNNLYLYATVSRNYHLPTLNDLYWYPGGNSNLKPEDGFESEMGINYLMPLSKSLTLALDLSGYYSDINNWIQWKPTDYRYWVPENIARVLARGMEVSVKITGTSKKWRYRLSGEYAWTVTTDESRLAKEEGYNGRQLIYIPVHHGNMFLYINFTGWSFSLNTLITGERKTTMNKQESFSNNLPAYLLNDMQVGKKWRFDDVAFHLLFKINNLFDVQYQAVLWRAMPGRNFEVELKLDLD